MSVKADAVIFDMDGVIVDSEQVWASEREGLVRERGGRWLDEANGAMMGMSSLEWSRYMRDDLRLDMTPDEISREVVARLERRYREQLPLLPGAREAVESLAAQWPLGVASSANRELIDLVLELADLQRHFTATVSSEEVPHGKPAPDVYLEAARRLGVAADRCVAIEDSSSGIRAAAAAGMSVIAYPNPHFPPDEDALALASARIASLDELVTVPGEVHVVLGRA
jgi:HAD superfamily hydrolase (TIGR01509 family)